MTDETKQVVVVLGPYAGKTLLMPADEAAGAIEAKWALEPRGTVDQYGPPVENLTPEEREAAEAAAAEWAAGVGGKPAPKEKAADPAERDMQPEPHRGSYKRK